MKSRAFTLMEMIAVITILGVILLIATPQLSKLIMNNKDDEYIAFVKLVEKAAYTYADFKSDFEIKEVELKDLDIREINEDVVDSGNQKIKIGKENGKIIIQNSNGQELSIKFQNNISCTTKKCTSPS